MNERSVKTARERRDAFREHSGDVAAEAEEKEDSSCCGCFPADIDGKRRESYATPVKCLVEIGRAHV